MSGFIGLDELFRKLELELSVCLSTEDRARIKKCLYPLSLTNKMPGCAEDFATALTEQTAVLLEKEVRDFLVDYLDKNKQDML